MIQLLIDADTLLELFLKRHLLRKEVNQLEHFLELNSIDLCVTQDGLAKCRRYLKNFTEPKGYRKIIRFIKRTFTVLSTDHFADREALKHQLIDIESAFEVAYASKNQIGAIITHRPDNYSGASLQVLSIEQLEKRIHLEQTLYLGEGPEIITIESLEKVKLLDKLFEVETYQNNLEYSQHNYSFLIQKENSLLSKKWQPVSELKFAVDTFLSVSNRLNPELNRFTESVGAISSQNYQCQLSNIFADAKERISKVYDIQTSFYPTSIRCQMDDIKSGLFTEFKIAKECLARVSDIKNRLASEIDSSIFGVVSSIHKQMAEAKRRSAFEAITPANHRQLYFDAIKAQNHLPKRAEIVCSFPDSVAEFRKHLSPVEANVAKKQLVFGVDSQIHNPGLDSVSNLGGITAKNNFAKVSDAATFNRTSTPGEDITKERLAKLSELTLTSSIRDQVVENRGLLPIGATTANNLPGFAKTAHLVPDLIADFGKKVAALDASVTTNHLVKSSKVEDRVLNTFFIRDRIDEAKRQTSLYEITAKNNLSIKISEIEHLIRDTTFDKLHSLMSISERKLLEQYPKL